MLYNNRTESLKLVQRQRAECKMFGSSAVLGLHIPQEECVEKTLPGLIKRFIPTRILLERN